MNQIATERVNEEVATGGAGDDRADVVEDQPLDGGDELGLDGGQFGSDLDPRGVGFGPGEEEDGGAVGEGEGVSVDGAEKVGVVNEPARFAGADFAQLLAGYAAQLGLVGSPRHALLCSALLRSNTGGSPIQHHFPHDDDASLFFFFFFGARGFRCHVSHVMCLVWRAE